MDVEKHARDGASCACAETVSLDDGGDVVEKGVVYGRDEHVGQGGVSVHGWGLGLLGCGSQAQRRRGGGGFRTEADRRAQERVEHVGRLCEGVLVVGRFSARMPCQDAGDCGFGRGGET